MDAHAREADAAANAILTADYPLLDAEVGSRLFFWHEDGTRLGGVVIERLPDDRYLLAVHLAGGGREIVERHDSQLNWM